MLLAYHLGAGKSELPQLVDFCFVACGLATLTAALAFYDY